MKLLIFGDIVGEAGIRALAGFLSSYGQKDAPDFVVANGENLTHKGLDLPTVNRLFDLGVDVITSGDHAWDNKEGRGIYAANAAVIRPDNFPKGLGGSGSVLIRKKGVYFSVLNLIGQAFFREKYDSFFPATDKWLSELPKGGKVVSLVDMHAEATSEKRGLGFYLDGKATAVYGTHTHVPTADEQILPKGTAYLSDVGMSGALNSILGSVIDTSLERLKTLERTPLMEELEPPYEVNALAIEANPDTGKAEKVARIRTIIG